MSSIKQKLEELDIKFSESYTKGSSFLFSDGSFCNMCDQGGIGIAHHNLDTFIIYNQLITDNEYKEIKEDNQKRKRPYFIATMQERILRYTDNVCVLNDGSNYNWENCYIDLPPEMPKGKQLEQLTFWIDDRHYKNPVNKRRLDISLESIVKTFNLDQDSTDEIIKEIKKLYNKSYNNNDNRKE